MLDLGIVIVSYNTRDLLRACLRSVYASHGDFTFQVCVVDNASSDGSADMVAAEFPQAELIANAENRGYPAANNQGLKAFGFGEGAGAGSGAEAPRFALLLNSDTEVPADALTAMLDFMGEHPDAGAAGPRLVRPDGSLDLACRRSFPTPEISFYRMTGLSKLFPRSPRFGQYNLTYLDPDQLTEVDSVVGAFMLVRGEAIREAGLMDETFFMYGEDLDWAYRIKDAGWRIYYNPDVTVLHVKKASTRQNPRAQIEFYRAMEIFYRKHFASQTTWFVHSLIIGAISARLALERLRVALSAA
ncbi:MAG: glycosyltransferase family 2 protein [Chloroflexota bacterium]|nr:glycosyltransferase family 2 protein [Chloroflexota bacterium]